MTRTTNHWHGEQVAAPVFDRPVFIIGAPRSGSTLLFESLRRIPGIWSIGGESHKIFDLVLQHHFGNPHFTSIRATERDAVPEKTDTLIRLFSRHVIEAGSRRRYRDRRPGRQPRSIRLLDKLPKNSFRVAFLAASFPDARFIFLSRTPLENISSLIDGWRHGRATGRFVTYKRLPDTAFENWCFVLPPGWRRYVDRPLEEIAAFQWMTANETALDDLLTLPRDRWCALSYEALVSQPAVHLRGLSEFMGLKAEERDFGIEDGRLPVSRAALTPPNSEKWRTNAAVVMQVLPQVKATAERLNRMFVGHAAGWER